jgi:hypothetical protein
MLNSLPATFNFALKAIILEN